MKKLLLAAVAATAFSSAFAAGEHQGNANLVLQATAIKKTEPKLEISANDRNVEFLYVYNKAAFESRKKSFTVSIKDAPAGNEFATKNFKLEAALQKNLLVNQADQSTLEVKASIGDVVLDNTFKSIVDSNGGKNLLKTDFVADANTGRSDADGEVTLSLINYKEAGSAAELSKAKTGVWSGDVDLKFFASWDQ